jgi:hypothetical protein
MDRRFYTAFITLCIIIYGLIPCPSLSAPDETINIVFDLDRTLMDSWDLEKPVPKGSRFIDVNFEGRTERYILREGAMEAIESFRRIPGVKVSIFSLREYPRNIEAAKVMKLPNGQSVFDAIDGRVFSGHHMFMHGVKKDLKAIDPNINLDRAILIDDEHIYSAPDQIRNLLWMRQKVAPYGRPKIAERKEFFRVRNKLAWARGLIDKAMENSKASGRSLVTELRLLQYNATKNQQLDLYVRGVSLFLDINPDYKYTTLIPKRCTKKVLDELLDILFKFPADAHK